MNPTRTWTRITALLLTGTLVGLLPAATASAHSSWLEDIIISSITLSDVIISSAQAPDGPRTQHFALGQSATGEVFLIDGAGAERQRLTPLGLAAAPGAARGALQLGPDGTAWLAVSNARERLELFWLGDVTVPGKLPITRVASTPVGRSYDPDSLRVGIIAILIGVVREPVPTLSFQDGSAHRVLVYDGVALLPFIEQDN